MDFTPLLESLQYSSLAEWVNTGGATYPIIESLHVIAIAMVFGTIMVVDLRLLGLASHNRPFTRVAKDLLHLTWIGFCVAVVTGILLFLPNATSIAINTSFQVKMVLLLLAGINMFVFEFVTARSVEAWDTTFPPPNAARVAGLFSLALWTGIIVFGRLIGFTPVAGADPFAVI